jgi:hypothetical protein
MQIQFPLSSLLTNLRLAEGIQRGAAVPRQFAFVDLCVDMQCG